MSDDLENISRIMKERKTVKVIGSVDAPLSGEGISQELLDQLLEAAGWAPFHYPSHNSYRGGDKDIAVEPWRAYKFDQARCRLMMAAFGPDDNPGIIQGMLAAADALVNVTWLPDPGEVGGEGFAATDRNVEHIAAASAFVQNLLLAASAAGYTTYWSSGGVFRKERYLKTMGASEGEMLLGSVFLFPKDTPDCELRSGKLRTERSGPEGWSRWVDASV